jgi:deoxyribodipyrimidine photolyase-related protein
MFIKDHNGYFRSQPRLGMMTRQLDRMSAETLDTHRRRADSFLDKLS